MKIDENNPSWECNLWAWSGVGTKKTTVGQFSDAWSGVSLGGVLGVGGGVKLAGGPESRRLRHVYIYVYIYIY